MCDDELNLAQRGRHGEAWRGLTDQPATTRGLAWWALVVVWVVALIVIARCSQ